jgi:hypothetical protein
MQNTTQKEGDDENETQKEGDGEKRQNHIFFQLKKTNFNKNNRKET